MTTLILTKLMKHTKFSLMDKTNFKIQLFKKHYATLQLAFLNVISANINNLIFRLTNYLL